MSGYKKALNSFFLKVHPDFFGSNRLVQQANGNGIAQLNELLSWARSLRDNASGTIALRAPPARSLKLSFYFKQDSTIAPFTRRIESRDLSDPELPQVPGMNLIAATFELPSGIGSGAAGLSTAERAVNDCLRELLIKAQCLSPEAEPISKTENEISVKGRSRSGAGKSGVQTMRRRGTDPPLESQKSRTLLDEAAAALSDSWTLTPPPRLEDLFESDQVIFSRLLSPAQCAAAMQTLASALPDMQYHRWSCMPLVVTDSFGVGSVSGSISVPWDFTLERFLAFFNSRAVDISACADAANALAQRVEHAVSRLCKETGNDDVLISCSHREALRCIELLLVHLPLLTANDIRGITLEIGFEFGYRDNGVVIIDKDATFSSLPMALSRLRLRMPLQRQIYALARQMLDSTHWHLQQAREMIKPLYIDIKNSAESGAENVQDEHRGGRATRGNSALYAQRLQWAKELFSIAPRLAAWDWSETAFVLGPLDINWGRNMVVLPPNFDGGSFVRYVEEVHKAAKQKKWRDVGRDMESVRQMEHLASEMFAENPISAARTEDQVEEQQKGDENVPRDVILKRKIAEACEGQDEISRIQLKKRRDALQAAQPYLDEYIVTSPSGDDSLSTERPLYHDYDFDKYKEDGAELAHDQLRWEGFYDTPFVRASPDRDMDDVATAYFFTQRRHREEAMQRLLRQYRRNYGVTYDADYGRGGTSATTWGSQEKSEAESNNGIRGGSTRIIREARLARNNGQHNKMGDLFGLNNPYVRPKGADKPAPGTFQGEG